MVIENVCLDVRHFIAVRAPTEIVNIKQVNAPVNDWR